MPNFDGKGPLKRGRVIGRGRGPCDKDDGRNAETDSSRGPETERRDPV
ncbi:MAG: hypothetical protein A4E34_02186 [Methanoregula sp. PtaU1.Bin006]|nr:DUF5320 family protein [Methanoregula sp. PtaU1.Bin006]OPY32809.1 MAG: hypothetical protein A4E34_02186 [Methanoregula sp. PtaU1.Bin006]